MIWFIAIVMLLICVYNVYLQVHEIKQNKLLKKLKQDNKALTLLLNEKQDK